MNLFSKIIPDFRFNKLTDIDVNIFLNKNLLIFDVDNTLVFPETTKTAEEIINWFEKINKNYKCVFVSNSRTIKKRKDKIFRLLKCEIFLSKFKKPSRKLFKSIQKTYNAESDKIVVIGDRIFPDILFGNLNGAGTILVNPLSNQENILIKIIRKIERVPTFFGRFF